MAISDARKKANKKWNDENLKVKYDRIQLIVPSGKKEVIQEFAKSKGKSLNSFVNEAIDKEMGVTSTPDTQPVSEPEQSVAEQPQQSTIQPEPPTKQRQSFEEYLKMLPESVIQTRSREDLFMQYRESQGLA